MTNYDQRHQIWERAHAAGSPVKYARNRLVHAALAELTPGRTLDAGCGQGEYSLFLAARGHQVTAFDPSPYAVGRFRERLAGWAASSPTGPRLDIAATVDTIDDCNFGPDFDNVVCVEVLEHLADDWAAAARLAGMIRPGGRLVVSVPAGPGFYSRADRVSGHYRRYTRPRLIAVLAAAGLARIEVRGYGFPVLFTYHALKKLFLDRWLLKRFGADNQEAPGVAPVSASKLVRLARLYPGVLALDCLPLGWGSIGHVAIATKK